MFAACVKTIKKVLEPYEINAEIETLATGKCPGLLRTLTTSISKSGHFFPVKNFFLSSSQLVRNLKIVSKAIECLHYSKSSLVVTVRKSMLSCVVGSSSS